MQRRRSVSYTHLDVYKRQDLEKLKVAELREKADELGVDHKGLKKAELVDAVLDASAVSYTHLDVYKRQSLRSALSNIKSW